MYLTVFHSIERCHLLHFYYDGYFRVAEPHDYGIDRRGRTVVYGYQVAGTDLMGRHVGWKCYLVDKVDALHVLDAHFLGPRATYTPKTTRTWQRVYIEVKGCRPSAVQPAVRV